MRELWIESWQTVPIMDEESSDAMSSIEPNFAAYAAIKSLFHNESLQGFHLYCHINSGGRYNGFNDRLSGRNCMYQSRAATSSLAGALVSALKDNRYLRTLDLTDSIIDDKSFSLIVHSLETNTSLKSFEAFFHRSESRRQSALQLFRTNTSLEDQSIILLLETVGNRVHEDALLDREEIAGWLDLNKKGRRDLFSETITKERAVDLLIETKENTHCAYGILLMKPELFFS